MTQFRPSRFQILPEVVKNLLIINGLVFLATMVLDSVWGIDLIEMLGLYYHRSSKFEYYQCVTHLFIHGSFLHLFSNMFALWMFGAVLENIWGPKRFLFYYLVTGLGAAFFHSLITYYGIASFQHEIEQYAMAPTFDSFHQIVNDNVPEQYLTSFQQLLTQWSYQGDSEVIQNQSVRLLNQLLEIKKDIPTVGASGAVFGVLLAFGMMFPNTYIFLYFFFPLKAKYFVMLYALFELYAGLQNNPTDNVAHFAHLGGMIFGFFLIKHWNKRNRIDFY